MDLRISATLAASYAYAGRPRDAAALYEAAYRQVGPLGREDTRLAAAILNNWANALLALGRPLEAERRLRQAFQVGSAREEDATPISLNNLARALRDVDRLSEAAHYAELAYAKARKIGQEIATDQSLFARSSIYRLQGNLPRAALVLAELVPRLERFPQGTSYGRPLPQSRRNWRRRAATSTAR